MVEAGLGGRHDATNVLGAPVAVLTNVGLEHTRWLGPTLTDIAREKLAVVAPGSTLVVGPLEPEVEAEVAKVDARVRARRPRPTARRSGLPARELRRRAQPPAAALLGALDDAAVLRAASAVTVPGRFEVVGEAPLTIFDGAHNPSGVAALAAALREAVGERPLVAVLSVLDDKDAAGMLRELVAAVRGRGLHRVAQPARALAGDARLAVEPAVGPAGEIEADPHAAVGGRASSPATDGAVVATGSIYLVADLLSAPGTRRRASAL